MGLERVDNRCFSWTIIALQFARWQQSTRWLRTNTNQQEKKSTKLPDMAEKKIAGMWAFQANVCISWLIIVHAKKRIDLNKYKLILVNPAPGFLLFAAEYVNSLTMHHTVSNNANPAVVHTHLICPPQSARRIPTSGACWTAPRASAVWRASSRRSRKTTSRTTRTRASRSSSSACRSSTRATNRVGIKHHSVPNPFAHIKCISVNGVWPSSVDGFVGFMLISRQAEEEDEGWSF